MINLPDYKRIHCIGIGGIGLSAIAEILISRGYEVSGSDMRESEIIERLIDEGANIYFCLLYTSRIGDFLNGSEILKKGDHFTLTSEKCMGTLDRVSVTYKALPSQVETGTVILIDDGRVKLKVIQTTDTDVVCEVTEGGKVSNRKGVNIPNKSLDLEYISEADRNDILFGIKMDVDYVAASFVRSGKDVEALRKLLNDNDGDVYKRQDIESVLMTGELIFRLDSDLI